MYNAYFGFRERPFNITPDPRFFYVNPVYQEAYASLLYGIRERKGFLVLTGEVGTGKTTLLRKVISTLDESIQFAFLYNTSLSFDEFLRCICDDFGLAISEHRRRLSYLQALNTFLLDQLAQGGNAVLFIDEAQNLDDRVLENFRLLSNLETATEKLLQIVLVGQPELEQKFRQPQLQQLKQRVAIQCQLSFLKKQEVGLFIQQRLRTVEYTGPELFPVETVERIWAYSHGTPRLINVLCDNALLLAYSLSQSQVSPEMIDDAASVLQLRASNLDNVPPSLAHQDSQKHSRVTDQRKEEGNDSASSEGVAYCMMELSTRQPLRIGTGMLIAFLLLGAVGMAISPHPTGGHVSQLGVEMKEMFATMAAHVATAQHNLLAWLTTPQAEEVNHDKVQDAVHTHSLGDPEQHSLTHTHTDQLEQQPPLSERAQLLSSQEPSTEALVFVHQEPHVQEAVPHKSVTLLSREHQRDTQMEIEQRKQQEKNLLKTTKENSIVVTALPQGQSEVRAGKKTEAPDTDREKPVTGKSSAKSEDILKKQEEARALLEQMGYATNGTALLESAENGNTTLVNLLLTAGLSPDQTDTKDWTPLMYAAWNGHITTVSELLARGATVNAKNRGGGGTALMVAAMNGHTATVQALQEHGAEVNTADEKGWTPLMYAAWNGHTATVRSLIKSKANVNAENQEGWTALMYAVWRGHITTVQTLLDEHAEVHTQTKDGETALTVAASYGQTRIIELLEKSSARE